MQASSSEHFLYQKGTGTQQLFQLQERRVGGIISKILLGPKVNPTTEERRHQIKVYMQRKTSVKILCKGFML